MNYSDIDIQLQKTTEDSEIIGLVNGFYESETNAKNARARNWLQSLRFFAGDQWIQWNDRAYNWESIPVTENNRAIDRPTTNYFTRCIIINASQFTCRPNYTVDPNSQDPRDKSAAKAGMTVLDYLWEQQDKGDSYYEAALWMLICGIVFRKAYKAPTVNYLEKEQDKRSYLYMPDHEIVAPHRISTDALPKRWRNIGVILDAVPRRLTWIKEHYGKDLPGYTGEAQDLVEEDISGNMVSMYEGIKNIIEGGTYLNQQTGNAAQELKNCAVVKELFFAPCAKYPRGRMLVVASNKLLYDSYKDNIGSPYYYAKGKVWHPFTHCRFLPQPGSLYGLSLAQSLIPMQRRINSIDALLAYNRKTVAVGTWLIPNGCNVPDEHMIGIPGQNISYDELPTGQRPEKIPGTPLPNQIIDERKMLISDMNEIAFNADVRAGDNPTGVNTVGQLEIMREQSEGARSKQIEAWERFVELSEQLDLLNFQDCYKAPLPEVAKDLKRLSQDITADNWETFVGADLTDNASVRIEKGSSVRESKLLRQNTILNLAKAGLLGEVVTDPLQHKKFLDEFGLASFYSDNNVDMKMAEYAIEKMKEGEYPPVLDIHNPDIQLIVLTRHMKDPKFLEYSDDVKFLFDKRKNAYMDMLAESLVVPAGNTVDLAGSKSPMAGAEAPPEEQGPDMSKLQTKEELT